MEQVAVHLSILTEVIATAHPAQLAEGEATIISIDQIEVEAEAEDIQAKTMDIFIIHQEVHVHIVRGHMRISSVNSTIQPREDETD